MAKRESTVETSEDTASAFVALPVRTGETVRILGPEPGEAAATVDPLVKLDEPLTVVQSFIGGVCDLRGRLVRPLEIAMVVDPATVVPDERVPTSAVLERFGALPELRICMPARAGFEALRAALADDPRIGPLLYCRKRHCVFAARSPETSDLLYPVPADEATDARDGDGHEFSSWLLSWDVVPDAVDSAEADDSVNTADTAVAHRVGKSRRKGQSPAIYGGQGGNCAAGAIASLEALTLGQGQVAEHAEKLAKRDRLAAEYLVNHHACSGCPERERCYPIDDGYAYAADRLVAISAAAASVIVSPLGEWRFDEACRVIGGLAPSACLESTERAANAYKCWRGAQAKTIECAGPARLLTGETDGRELVEVARLKLALIADVLEQLDAAWRGTKRPHLCWNAETVRVAWNWPVAVPGTCWGFHAVLRKTGLQPATPIESVDGPPLPYPPAFSDASYLPAPAADAARYFDEPRKATMFVKKPQSGDGSGAQVLLEGLGISWELFSTGDTLHTSGAGWHAVLSPAPQRDPGDGEGLPFTGRVTGDSARFKKGGQFEDVESRWYPRFGEAVDLHAVGMLLFEALTAHDERSPQALREQLCPEVADLTKSCQALPIEQREQHVRNWITERCETDAPAALWTRRNLLYRRDARNATSLDGLSAALWKEIVVIGVRMTTRIAGFSYCDDRSRAAPRIDGDLLLPLVELRGLIALLDDAIFSRAAPASATRQRVDSAG